MSNLNVFPLSKLLDTEPQELSRLPNALHVHLPMLCMKSSSWALHIAQSPTLPSSLYQAKWYFLNLAERGNLTITAGESQPRLPMATARASEGDVGTSVSTTENRPLCTRHQSQRLAAETPPAQLPKPSEGGAGGVVLRSPRAEELQWPIQQPKVQKGSNSCVANKKLLKARYACSHCAATWHLLWSIFSFPWWRTGWAKLLSSMPVEAIRKVFADWQSRLSPWQRLFGPVAQEDLNTGGALFEASWNIWSGMNTYCHCAMNAGNAGLLKYVLKSSVEICWNWMKLKLEKCRRGSQKPHKASIPSCQDTERNMGCGPHVTWALTTVSMSSHCAMKGPTA